MRCVIFFLLILTTGPSQAQDFDLQDFEVTGGTRTFFAENAGMDDFLEESCPNFESCSHYNYHQKLYRFEGDAREAFEQLVQNTGKDLWGSGSSRFELMFDPSSQSLKKEDLPLMELGQVYFLELDIVRLMKIPVAFKIVELDHENLRLAFSYLKNNKSNGIQRLTFIQKRQHFQIVHETRFKSDSKVRDALFYRPFHTILLDDFYRNFESSIYQR